MIQLKQKMFRISPRAATGALALAIGLVLAVATTPVVQAQTYQVLHYFQSGQDGANPASRCDN